MRIGDLVFENSSLDPNYHTVDCCRQSPFGFKVDIRRPHKGRVVPECGITDRWIGEKSVAFQTEAVGDVRTPIAEILRESFVAADEYFASNLAICRSCLLYSSTGREVFLNTRDVSRMYIVRRLFSVCESFFPIRNIVY